MRVLLDTHAFLWFEQGDQQLSRRARQLLNDRKTELFLSAASIWEMAIKASLGRLDVGGKVHDYIADRIKAGYHILSVEWMHAAVVETLPAHLRDPFDRLLAAQALKEKLPLVTKDKVFSDYGVQCVW